MHLTIFWILGTGRPRHRFVSVQLAFLMKELYGGEMSSKSAIGSIAPDSITRSRTSGPSPDMLPRPQIAYSITSL